MISEKFDLQSSSIQQGQYQRLRDLFPEVFTEDNIDFERLRATPGDSIGAGTERLGLPWPGNGGFFQVIQEPARVVCLDGGLAGNDQLRANAVQIMKSHGVNDFRTV